MLGFWNYYIMNLKRKKACFKLVLNIKEKITKKKTIFITFLEKMEKKP